MRGRMDRMKCERCGGPGRHSLYGGEACIAWLTDQLEKLEQDVRRFRKLLY